MTQTIEVPAHDAPVNGYTPATEFHIDSEERACWLLRKMANLEAGQKRIHAQAGQMIAALQADRNRMLFWPTCNRKPA